MDRTQGVSRGRVFHGSNIDLSEGRVMGAFDLMELMIGLAIKVHRVVGPGLPEPVFQTCVAGDQLDRYSVSPSISGSPAGWLRNVRLSCRRAGRA